MTLHADVLRVGLATIQQDYYDCRCRESGCSETEHAGTSGSADLDDLLERICYVKRRVMLRVLLKKY